MISDATQYLNPIQNTDKVEQAVKVLQEFIINGNLKPGTDLPAESEMASNIGVSKFSMREALRVLESQGLIDITQGRRTKVAEFSITPISEMMVLALRRSKSVLADLMEARQCLECDIARFAAVRAKPPHIDALIQTIRELEENRTDLDICVEKDLEFHNILINATGNKVFEIMLSPLTELLRKSRLKTMKRDGIEHAIRGHKSILAAVQKKDPAKAALAMRDHLQMAEKDLKR
ncbi:MAG: FadR/GntR family transcriptional regulator [Phycisphaerae bacterium]